MNSPHKGQWRRVLMFSFACAWTNSWLNNRDAGDLRRHRAHYDVTVMTWTNMNILSVINHLEIDSDILFLHTVCDLLKCIYFFWCWVSLWKYDMSYKYISNIHNKMEMFHNKIMFCYRGLCISTNHFIQHETKLTAGIKDVPGNLIIRKLKWIRRMQSHTPPTNERIFNPSRCRSRHGVRHHRRSYVITSPWCFVMTSYQPILRSIRVNLFEPSPFNHYDVIKWSPVVRLTKGQ